MNFNKKDEKIYYFTCEGFAKLLANRCALENRDKIIASLVIAYMTTTTTTISDDEKATSGFSMNKKLLACLNAFLHLLKRVDLVALVRSFLPTLKFLISKQASLETQRRLAKLFYFLTGETKNQRQTLMIDVMKEIFDNIDDYLYIQRLIEILIEFRVHQCDVCETDSRSVDLLRNIYNQLHLILVSK